MDMTAERAVAFSRTGDEAFARVAGHFPEAERWRLAVAQELPAARFAQIRAALSAYISACLGGQGPLDEPALLELLVEQRSALASYTPGGMLVAKREQVLEWNLLHKAVAAAFADYRLDDVIDGIDLPINVRVVYGGAGPDGQPGAAPPAYASSKLHVDVWAGVPVDSVVVVLPVLGDIQNITIVLGEMARELELPAMRAMADYDEGRGARMAVPYRDAELAHGRLCLADVRLLHQTVRRRKEKDKEGVRVSIDFRFRMNHAPYRALAPDVSGPEAIDLRVPYDRWLGIGSREMIVFDESMAEAADHRHEVSSLPVYDGDYRIVPLFPPTAAVE
jgi:hypothetical protein